MTTQYVLSTTQFENCSHPIQCKALPLPPCWQQWGEELSSYSFLTLVPDGMSGQRHVLCKLMKIKGRRNYNFAINFGRFEPCSLASKEQYKSLGCNEDGVSEEFRPMQNDAKVRTCWTSQAANLYRHGCLSL
jgi:hypothetical protein